MNVFVALGIVAFGLGVGALSGLFGVGGGLLMVPFMVLALGESQHVAEGSSLLVIVPTAVAGIIAHHQRGFVSFRAAAILAIGGLVGAVVGALIALNVDTESLQTGFAVFVLVVGLRMVRDGWRERKLDTASPPPSA